MKPTNGNGEVFCQNNAHSFGFLVLQLESIFFAENLSQNIISLFCGPTNATDYANQSSFLMLPWFTHWCYSRDRRLFTGGTVLWNE
jgi:hypothetical protein